MNIPLPFLAMWLIQIAGVLTAFLAKVNEVNQKSADDILWYNILRKFIRKEWASYGMSLIFTCIIAYSFQFMKQFDKIDNEEISWWAKWIPAAVLALYFIGVLNQFIFYKILGRIERKGSIDTAIINKPEQP